MWPVILNVRTSRTPRETLLRQQHNRGAEPKVIILLCHKFRTLSRTRYTGGRRTSVRRRAIGTWCQARHVPLRTGRETPEGGTSRVVERRGGTPEPKEGKAGAVRTQGIRGRRRSGSRGDGTFAILAPRTGRDRHPASAPRDHARSAIAPWRDVPASPSRSPTASSRASALSGRPRRPAARPTATPPGGQTDGCSPDAPSGSNSGGVGGEEALRTSRHAAVSYSFEGRPRASVSASAGW